MVTPWTPSAIIPIGARTTRGFFDSGMRKKVNSKDIKSLEKSLPESNPHDKGRPGKGKRKEDRIVVKGGILSLESARKEARS